jgi:hypothetical protein
VKQIVSALQPFPLVRPTVGPDVQRPRGPNAGRVLEDRAAVHVEVPAAVDGRHLQTEFI